MVAAALGEQVLVPCSEYESPAEIVVESIAWLEHGLVPYHFSVT
jgi:hypothetical protein